jgi:hypothetical protein
VEAQVTIEPKDGEPEDTGPVEAGRAEAEPAKAGRVEARDSAGRPGAAPAEAGEAVEQDATGPAGRLPSLVVGDLSFISLRLVLEPIRRCVTPDADYVLMVKPQFEVGKDRVGAGGVVRDPALRAEAVRDVARHAMELGLGVKGVTASPLPGPSGNVEYFLWLRAGAPPLNEADLATAVAEGPQ